RTCGCLGSRRKEDRFGSAPVCCILLRRVARLVAPCAHLSSRVARLVAPFFASVAGHMHVYATTSQRPRRKRSLLLRIRATACNSCCVADPHLGSATQQQQVAAQRPALVGARSPWYNGRGIAWIVIPQRVWPPSWRSIRPTRSLWRKVLLRLRIVPVSGSLTRLFVGTGHTMR